MSRDKTQQQDGAISAIATRYNGYHFRSRLEARWAVFFDAIGCRWQYEPNGYQLADRSIYLPDFLIEEGTPSAAHVEVKPPVQSAIKEGLQKCIGLIETVGASVSVAMLVIGAPGDRDVVSFVKGMNGVNYQFFENTAVAFGSGKPVPYAISAARSARFEHGQSGKT
jgi:hypothetical protein